MNLNFFIRPLCELILLFCSSSHMSKASTTWFATYHLHQKNKLIGNLSWTFIYTTNYLYFLCGQRNHSTAFFFIYNGSTQITKAGIVTKKRKLPKSSLHFFSHFFQPLSVFCSSTTLKMCLKMFEYLIMPRCTPIFKCTLMSEYKVSIDFFHTIPNS